MSVRVRGECPLEVELNRRSDRRVASKQRRREAQAGRRADRARATQRPTPTARRCGNGRPRAPAVPVAGHLQPANLRPHGAGGRGPHRPAVHLQPRRREPRAGVQVRVEAVPNRSNLKSNKWSNRAVRPGPASRRIAARRDLAGPAVKPANAQIDGTLTRSVDRDREKPADPWSSRGPVRADGSTWTFWRVVLSMQKVVFSAPKVVFSAPRDWQESPFLRQKCVGKGR